MGLNPSFFAASSSDDDDEGAEWKIMGKAIQ